MKNPVTPAEARAFAQAKLNEALRRVAAGEPGARADLIVGIGAWEGSTGEPAPGAARRGLVVRVRV